MKQAEIWWADLGSPAGKRPVLLLSRNEAYKVRELVTIAPVTTRIRDIPSEVRLGLEDGVPKTCVINLDTISTVSKNCLIDHLTTLTYEKWQDVKSAIRFVFTLD